MPINGKIFNQSNFYREPKSSGCLFISLSLIKPNCLLKIVFVPYANRQGMMQQVGNETGKWVVSKLFLHLPWGLGKLPGLRVAAQSPGDTAPSCQETFVAACDVPPLWPSHFRARSPLHPQPCTSRARWHELQTACDQKWATPFFSWGTAVLTPLFSSSCQTQTSLSHPSCYPVGTYHRGMVFPPLSFSDCNQQSGWEPLVLSCKYF